MLAQRRRFTRASEQPERLGQQRELQASRPCPLQWQIDDYLAHDEFEAMLRKLDHDGVSREPPAGWHPRYPTALMLAEERDAYRAQQAATNAASP